MLRLDPGSPVVFHTPVDVPEVEMEERLVEEVEEIEDSYDADYDLEEKLGLSSCIQTANQVVSTAL